MLFKYAIRLHTFTGGGSKLYINMLSISVQNKHRKAADEMIHIVISIILITVCCFKGNWRNWRQYYPTILLFITGDAVYNFVMHDYSLWEYRFPGWDILPHTLLDLYWAVVIFPCIVILFLTFLPEGVFKTSAYIAGWSAGFALVELVMYFFKSIEYFNRWNTFFSFLFDVVMFTVLYVHQKKPVAAWLIITAIVPLFLLIVHMPLSLIK